MSDLLLICIFALCIAGSLLYRRFVINKTLRRLYQLRQQGEEASYMQALDALDVRLYFSSFTRELLRLGYYLAKYDTPWVNALYDRLCQSKTNAKNRIALYSRVFPYFLEQKEEERAKACAKKLYELLADRKETKYVLLYNEVRQLEGIYLKRDLSWIEVLEGIVPQIRDEESLSVLQFRLAKLYMMKQDVEKSRALLLEAMTHSKDEASRTRLHYLLHHMQELV